jgi:D-serine deaminase-like pyridoxal phosphate-dependent protein
MAAAGVRDILIANQIVGPIKTRRLAALCAHADVIVAVDSVDNVRELDTAAGAAGTRPRVLVEVNSGMDRCGVAPGEEALALSHQIASCPHLRYAGVMAWEGHAMAVADPTAREQTVRTAIALLTETADACRAAGLPVEIVSCGGTGTYIVTAGIAGVTEVQAGGGTFGDAAYRELGAPVEPALTLLSQVVSRPCAERIVFDAGRKAVDPSFRPPVPRGLDGVVDSSLSAEHMTLALDGASPTVRIGDRFEFEIGYSDQTVHLHEQLYGIRNGLIETVWPIAARGRLQ